MNLTRFGASLSPLARTLISGVLAVALLASCQQLGSFENTRVFAPSLNLSGSRIYVYPFIDYRRSIIGYKLLRDLDPRLLAGLSEVSIEAQFAMPSLGAADTIPEQITSRSQSFVSNEYTSVIPIDAVIAAHASDERTFGANYRLLIVPVAVETSAKDALDGMPAPSYGVGLEGGEYTIRWFLVDIASNRIVMTTDYTEDNTGNKNAMLEERAQNWVDGLIEQMRLSHLLP